MLIGIVGEETRENDWRDAVSFAIKLGVLPDLRIASLSWSLIVIGILLRTRFEIV